MRKTILSVIAVIIIIPVVFVACTGMAKPTVGQVPNDWYLSDQASYGSFEETDGTRWGVIEYTDDVDRDMVQIYYGDIPPELKGNETDGDALIGRAVLESTSFYPTETGTMTAAGHLAGYARAYDAEYDIYELEIVFILGTSCIDIYAIYDANDADEAQVMLLINSIH